jgi:hypothetical protein
MQGIDGFDRFAAGGLELLGLEADEAERAVMAAVDAIYRPHVEALLAADLDDVDPEPRVDLSRGPGSDPAAPGREAEDGSGR